MWVLCRAPWREWCGTWHLTPHCIGDKPAMACIGSLSDWYKHAPPFHNAAEWHPAPVETKSGLSPWQIGKAAVAVRQKSWKGHKAITLGVEKPSYFAFRSWQSRTSETWFGQRQSCTIPRLIRRIKEGLRIGTCQSRARFARQLTKVFGARHEFWALGFLSALCRPSTAGWRQHCIRR
ncbi:hypothetical protein BDW69DRAFT_63395 [Aspergillus filifer]